MKGFSRISILSATFLTLFVVPRSAGLEECELKCMAPPVTVACDNRIMSAPYSFKSNAPLFTDARMKMECSSYDREMFKPTSKITAYKPFTGNIACGTDEAITGIEVCFQMSMVYIAPHCTGLEDGFSINYEERVMAGNSPEEPDAARCPDEKMVMTSLQLEEMEDGQIVVSITCNRVNES